MFFYLSKIVWFLIQPSSLLVLAPVVGLWASTRGRSVVARRAMFMSLAVAIVGLSPLGNLLMLPLEQRFERADLTARPVTGIVILGGGEDAPIAFKRNAHALNEAGERISEAVALSIALPSVRIVFSGGSGFLIPGGASEGKAVAKMLRSMGIAADRLTIEDQSRDTYENATLTRDLIKPQPGERWLLVTSAWHMPRAMGVFRKAGFAVEPWPVDYRTGGWGDAFVAFASPPEGLRRIDVATREYAGLAALWLKGRSSALFPAPCTSTPTCP
jgi:uncharacterized SAM-binding protein YcdF (DUF218 family)